MPNASVSIQSLDAIICAGKMDSAAVRVSVCDCHQKQSLNRDLHPKGKHVTFNYRFFFFKYAYISCTVRRIFLVQFCTSLVRSPHLAMSVCANLHRCHLSHMTFARVVSYLAARFIIALSAEAIHSMLSVPLGQPDRRSESLIVAFLTFYSLFYFLFMIYPL
jgi:hypothetical protein